MTKVSKCHSWATNCFTVIGINYWSREMKIIIFSLMLLSLPVLANSGHPFGLFQVDSSTSMITMLDQNQEATGFIDIQKDFRNSTLKVESSDSSFESTEIYGDAADFKIKGQLTHKGVGRTVLLTGRSFTSSGKVAWRLSDDTLLIRIIALRPSARSTEIQKQVEQIIQ